MQRFNKPRIVLSIVGLALVAVSLVVTFRGAIMWGYAFLLMALVVALLLRRYV